MPFTGVYMLAAVRSRMNSQNAGSPHIEYERKSRYQAPGTIQSRKNSQECCQPTQQLEGADNRQYKVERTGRVLAVRTLTMQEGADNKDWFLQGVYMSETV